MHPAEQHLEEQLATASEAGASRFVRVTLGLIVASLAILGGFNYLVDPHSLYGSPLELVRPRHVRLAKLELLRQANPPPRALILGSSRVRMLTPRAVELLFGENAFHAGGLKSTPQNWLSVTRYAVEELGYPIRLVILGVDPSSFVDAPNYLEHPAGAPELRPHLRHPRFSRFRTMVHLWSPRQTRESLAVLQANLTGEAASAFGGQYLWDENGFVRRFRALDPREITETAVSLHRSRGVVEDEHLADFEAFVDFAAEKGIRIVAYVTPETPELAGALARTHYPDTLRKTREILRGAEAKGLVFCDVDSLGLQRSDFVDPHHPTLGAGNRIVGALSACARAKGGD